MASASSSLADVFGKLDETISSAASLSSPNTSPEKDNHMERLGYELVTSLVSTLSTSSMEASSPPKPTGGEEAAFEFDSETGDAEVDRLVERLAELRGRDRAISSRPAQAGSPSK